MTATDQQPSTTPGWWAAASPWVARAGRVVRTVGPYLAFIAFALALYSIRGLEQNQARDNARAIAADVASCQIGNVRLEGNVEGISNALAELTQLVVDRANLQVTITEDELQAAAHDVAEAALRSQPQLRARDCDSIPGVDAADLVTTTVPVLIDGGP